jgi:ABC-type lipoprotein release transport system permease subunit
MIWSIAWKNVWRNKTRSAVVIVAVTLGLAGGIFAAAVMVGMGEQRVQSAISNEVSHIQIHHEKFKENSELKYTMKGVPSLLDSIRNLPEVQGASKRLKVIAMANTAGNATGVTLNGIDPDMEKKVTDIHEHIREKGGHYFGQDNRNPVVLGEELAKELKLVFYQLVGEDFETLRGNRNLEGHVMDSLLEIKAKKYRTEAEFENALDKQIGKKARKAVGHYIKNEAIKYKLDRKVIMNFTAFDGHLTGAAFRLTGVYRTSNSMFDQMNVFVRNDDLYSLLGMDESEAHEIAIRLADTEFDGPVAGKIASWTDYKVETWEEIQPDIKYTNSMLNMFTIVFMVIILFALGFGIVNTMLMVVLERVKEIGMLMAIGMNRKRVFFMIMLETVFLCLTGAILGMAISISAIAYFGQVGIDLTALYQEGFSAIGYSAVMYPEIGVVFFFEVTGLVIITGILASIYPARKALKLNPSEALRTE